MQRRVGLVGIMHEHTRVIRRHHDHLRHEGHRVDLHRQTFVIILTKDHLLAVFEDDAMLCALLTIGYPRVRPVVEDHAVNEALYDRAAFVLLRCHETINRRRHIHIQRTGEECTAGSKHELGRDERTLYRSKRRRFRYKTLRTRRAVLTFGQTIDAVVEHAYIQVHVTTYLMNKMVAADRETVAVTAHLPYR